ncbi:MAG: RadC family protein [Acutalibacteraceae bacterium]
MAEHLHGGHRGRVKQKYIENGIAPFSPHELIELLLFFGIPQKDTNPLAHRLMQTFGSVRGLLSADRAALLQVEGMTANAATLLTLVGDIRRYCAEEEMPLGTPLTTTDERVRYLRPRFEGVAVETVWMVSLDNLGQVIGSHMVSRGTPNMSEIGVRAVLQNALNDNAIHLIVAHNHPCGIALPSQDDLQTTLLLARALKGAGIRLVDHLIFARDNDCISMRDTPSLSAYLSGTEL